MAGSDRDVYLHDGAADPHTRIRNQDAFANSVAGACGIHDNSGSFANKHAGNGAFDPVHGGR